MILMYNLYDNLYIAPKGTQSLKGLTSWERRHVLTCGLLHDGLSLHDVQRQLAHMGHPSIYSWC